MSLFPVLPGGSGKQWTCPFTCPFMGPHRLLSGLGIVLDNTHGALRARSVPQGQWDGPVFRAEVDFGSTIPCVSIHCVLRHSLRATKVTRIKRQHQTYPRGTVQYLVKELVMMIHAPLKSF